MTVASVLSYSAIDFVAFTAFRDPSIDLDLTMEISELVENRESFERPSSQDAPSWMSTSLRLNAVGLERHFRIRWDSITPEALRIWGPRVIKMH